MEVVRKCVEDNFDLAEADALRERFRKERYFHLTINSAQVSEIVLLCCNKEYPRVEAGEKCGDEAKREKGGYCQIER